MRLPTVLVIQQDPTDPPGPLLEWLSEAGVLTRVVRADRGEAVPTRPVGESGLVLLGGAPSVAAGEDAAWPAGLRELLRHVASAQLPTFAICLGAQQLVAALGGRVGRNADGAEIGPALVAKRDAAAADPLFGAVPFTPDVMQWHHDEITLLPPGAVLLASSPRHAVQAYRVGERVWGVQFHVETTPEVVRQWVEEDAEELDRLGIAPQRLLDGLEAAHEAIELVWRPVLGRFAGVVRGHDHQHRSDRPTWAR